MRSRLRLVSLFGLLSCGDPRGDVAARVDDRVLSADRLAELMVLAQPVPLTTEAAYELASHWVTFMAFGKRMAAGDSLLDSTTIRDLMTHRIRQEVVGEWRGRLLARVPPAAMARFDSSYAQQLLRDKRARLDSAAAVILREIATDPWASKDSARPLATFAGGAVTSGQLQRYVQYLSPTTRQEMRAAPDARITDFLWGFVLDELLVAQADSAGVRLSEAAYRTMQEECREAIHAVWRAVGLSPAALAATGATVAEHTEVAAGRVEAYLEAAAARKVPLEPVPPFLAVPLLRAVEWEVAGNRMNGVVERARRLVAAAETARKP